MRISPLPRCPSKTEKIVLCEALLSKRFQTLLMSLMFLPTGTVVASFLYRLRVR